MATFGLKLVTTIAATFAVIALCALPLIWNSKPFAAMTKRVRALKAATVVIRMGFLLACAWAAWHEPKFAAWFAWGSFAAFGIGATFDVSPEGGFARLAA